MNKQRRKALAAVETKLCELRAELEGIKDEEQEYLDKMPEGIQESEKGSIAEEVVGNLDECDQLLDDVINLLDGILEP